MVYCKYAESLRSKLLYIQAINPHPIIKKQVLGRFVSVNISRRTSKRKSFHQISAVIDWAVFERERYKVCKRSIQDAVGRPAYHLLVLFKMRLLPTWHSPSNMGVEDMVNDTTSANAFCG